MAHVYVNFKRSGFCCQKLRPSLEQCDEIFYRYTRTANQRSQGAAVKFFMIGYGEMPPVGMIQDHVTSLLAVEDEADFLEHL